MTIEAATYIHQLNASYPEGPADRSIADDHLRLIKSAVKATFPSITGVVSVTHTELNLLTGLTDTLTTILSKFSVSISANSAKLTSISALNTSMLASIDSISNTVSVMNARLVSMSALHTAILADTAKFSVSISANSAQLASISALNTTMLADIAALSVSVSAINTSVAAVVAELATVSASISAIKASVSALQTQVDGITTLTRVTKSLSTASVDFTGIPGSARFIQLGVYDATGAAVGPEQFLVQLGDSGGVELTGYLATVTTTSWVLFVTAAAGFAGVNAVYSLVNVTGNTWAIQGASLIPGGTGVEYFVGVKTLSATLTTLRIQGIGDAQGSACIVYG